VANWKWFQIGCPCCDEFICPDCTGDIPQQFQLDVEGWESNGPFCTTCEELNGSFILDWTAPRHGGACGWTIEFDPLIACSVAGYHLALSSSAAFINGHTGLRTGDIKLFVYDNGFGAYPNYNYLYRETLGFPLDCMTIQDQLLIIQGGFGFGISFCDRSNAEYRISAL
jgi:hypothetical protein